MNEAVFKTGPGRSVFTRDSPAPAIVNPNAPKRTEPTPPLPWSVLIEGDIVHLQTRLTDGEGEQWMQRRLIYTEFERPIVKGPDGKPTPDPAYLTPALIHEYEYRCEKMGIDPREVVIAIERPLAEHRVAATHAPAPTSP